MNPTIRDVTVDDAQAICDIYNPYIAGTAISFEQQPVSVADMQARIRNTTETYPWLVTQSEDGVIAYAYATRWRARAAYDRTAESTIYVKSSLHRSGVAY